MNRILSIVFVAVLLVSTANADDGLVKLKSPHSVSQTLDRFENAIKAKGMTLFARIDHAQGAAKVNKELRPTELLIFGNPNIGTLLMQSNQSAAIDLPMKALAWKDADGQVWLAYNDPSYLVKRHGITDRDPVVEKIRKALSGFSAAATGK